MTLFGTSAEVMQRSMAVVPQRAARRGWADGSERWTNGGVYVHRNEDAMQKFSEEQLNKLRPFGFEQQARAS
eukprot:607310-Prymnesium_polylepis.1